MVFLKLWVMNAWSGVISREFFVEKVNPGTVIMEFLPPDIVSELYRDYFYDAPSTIYIRCSGCLLYTIPMVFVNEKTGERVHHNVGAWSYKTSHDPVTLKCTINNLQKRNLVWDGRGEDVCGAPFRPGALDHHPKTWKMSLQSAGLVALLMPGRWIAEVPLEFVAADTVSRDKQGTLFKAVPFTLKISVEVLAPALKILGDTNIHMKMYEFNQAIGGAAMEFYGSADISICGKKIDRSERPGSPDVNIRLSSESILRHESGSGESIPFNVFFSIVGNKPMVPGHNYLFDTGSFGPYRGCSKQIISVSTERLPRGKFKAGRYFGMFQLTMSAVP